MGQIQIQEMGALTPGEMDVEIVERKGLGHPDTICDAVMERVSLALCRSYLQRFGRILHYNCDKGLLVAGRVERRFGGGRVLEPMRLVIGDRATARVGEEELDIREIAVEAAKGWFRENLRFVDVGRDLCYQVELRPGSEELRALFAESAEPLGANDTSAAVGYAPLTETERLVLEAERYLNSAYFKSRFPETGEDVKVMGVRTGRKLDLTLAMPFIDRYVQGEADYFARKESVREDLCARLSAGLCDLDDVTVNFNALDRPGAGMAGIYLSVTGTSAEDADSGEVGRGNQVNGLISLSRPRGSEAAAGKNPVSHVGKIYSVLAHLLAERLRREIPALRDVVVWLCSRIGERIDRPQMVSVQVRPHRGFVRADFEPSIRQVVLEELERMPAFCRELAEARYAVY